MNIFKKILILILTVLPLTSMKSKCYNCMRINGHEGKIKKISLIDKNTIPKIKIEFEGDNNTVALDTLCDEIKEGIDLEPNKYFGYILGNYDCLIDGTYEIYKGKRTATITDISLHEEFDDDNKFYRYNFLVTFDNKTAISLFMLKEGIHVGSCIKFNDKIGWSYIDKLHIYNDAYYRYNDSFIKFSDGLWSRNNNNINYE